MCSEHGAILPGMVQFAGTERPKLMFESQRRSFLVIVLVLCAPAPFAAQAQSLSQTNGDSSFPDQPTKARPCYDDSSYDSFVSRYLNAPLGNVHADAEPVELIISSMEGDDRLVDAKIPWWPRCAGIMWSGIKVTPAANGYVYWHGEPNGTSSPIKLPEEYFARLQQFLAATPDDRKRVPPPGHRVILRAALGGVISVRLYDRAYLPDEIIELIRLTDSQIVVAPTTFQPSRRWKADQLQQGATSSAVLNASDIDFDSMFAPGRSVAESSDGSLLAVSSFFYRGSVLRVYNAAADQSVFELVFPPDGRRVIGPTYIGFNPDKSRFLLETNLPEIRILDTKTWKKIGDSSPMPPDTIRYVPSPDWTRGIAMSSNGKSSLWDASSHRVIAPLNVGDRVQSVSFSSVGDLLALTSGAGEGLPARLTLWDASSGHLMRELWPAQWRSKVQGQPHWWGSNQLLVAPVRPYLGRISIGVWEASTGRYQGTLAACAGDDISVEGDRLFQNCLSGEVLEWSAEAVRNEVQSLSGRLPR